MNMEKKLIFFIQNASLITQISTIRMNKTLLQTHIDLLNECCRQNEMLEKLIELNMNDLWDIADQRDWYYNEYRKLKDKLAN